MRPACATFLFANRVSVLLERFLAARWKSSTAILAVFFGANRGRMPLVLTGKMPVLRLTAVFNGLLALL